MLTAIRSPWELVHMNAHWTYENEAGDEITANFDTVTPTNDGSTFVSGKAVDEYGWWHRRTVISLDTVKNLRRAVGYKEPEPAPFRVGIGFEWRHSVIRLTIPDDDASRLRKWKADHWTEIPGVADGYSSCPRRGTWEHRALAYLHSMQSHLLDDPHPFIEGESFSSMKDHHGHARPEAWDVFVSTYGVCANVANATGGFHFQG